MAGARSAVGSSPTAAKKQRGAKHSVDCRNQKQGCGRPEPGNENEAGKQRPCDAANRANREKRSNNASGVVRQGLVDCQLGQDWRWHADKEAREEKE